MKKTKLHCCFLFFLFVIVVSNAQSPKIDSLKNELDRNSGIDKFDVLWGLAYELFDVDNFQAVEYAHTAHENALINGDTLGIVMSARIWGQLLRRVDKIDQSIDVLTLNLPIAVRHNFKKEQMFILNALALAHDFKAEYDKALGYHLESLILREKDEDKNGIGLSLNNIGLIYFRLENYELALDYFFRSLKIKKELAESPIENVLVNIGLCYNEVNDFKASRQYFNEALRQCFPTCRSEIIKEANFGLGVSYLIEKMYDEAQLYFRKSLSISNDMQNQRFQIESLVELIKIALIRNDLNLAGYYLSRIERLPDRAQFNSSIAEVYKLKAEFYLKKGDLKNVILFQQKYLDLTNLIFSSQVNKNILKIQTQFFERYNLARIESQAKIVHLQERALHEQKLLNYSFGLIAALIITVLVMLFKENVRKHRINRELNYRVRERTIELERHRDALKHEHDENALILSKVLSELGASVATIKGLTYAASHDSPNELVNYIKHTEITAERLFSSVNRYVNRE